MFAVRYLLPLAIFLAGVVVLIFEPGVDGWHGFFTATGAALSVLLLNWLFRVGVAGDRERQDEEDARTYFTEHGHWPDEPGDPPATGRAQNG